MEAYSKCGRTRCFQKISLILCNSDIIFRMCFNGLRGNSEVSAQKAKYTVCFVGYIVNVLIPL